METGAETVLTVFAQAYTPGISTGDNPKPLQEMTRLAQAFERLHPGVRVRFVKNPVGEYRTWMRTQGSSIDDPLFPSHGTYRRLTRGAIWRMVANHAATASRSCSSLVAKHVTPHVLRHTAAMTLLHAGVDLATIALWLSTESIESTNVYLHADMALKERALARTAPPSV